MVHSHPQTAETDQQKVEQEKESKRGLAEAAEVHV